MLGQGKGSCGKSHSHVGFPSVLAQSLAHRSCLTVSVDASSPTCTKHLQQTGTKRWRGRNYSLCPESSGLSMAVHQSVMAQRGGCPPTRNGARFYRVTSQSVTMMCELLDPAGRTDTCSQHLKGRAVSYGSQFSRFAVSGLWRRRTSRRKGVARQRGSVHRGMRKCIPALRIPSSSFLLQLASSLLVNGPWKKHSLTLLAARFGTPQGTFRLNLIDKINHQRRGSEELTFESSIDIFAKKPKGTAERDGGCEDKGAGAEPC